MSTDNKIQLVWEKFVAHYGVKGMRWGVSKEDSSSSSKSISEMSTKELQERVNRLNLERNYSRLIAEQSSSRSSSLNQGSRFVQQVLSNSAKQVATAFVVGQMNNVLKSLTDSRNN